ncbi:MAG TPA: sigma 54-interacting transcriptional regulator [Nitrospirota bacterium]|nr:sigma 54-interacting transcriptional regulator [Nitrospirota bacterium]
MNHKEKDLTQELSERLRFETMLTEISTGFINIPADQLDRAILDSQRRVCECLDLDRSTLWQISKEDRDHVLLTHIYQPPASPQPPDRMQAKDYFPWSQQKMLAGEIVVISRLSDFPPEAGRDQETFRLYETKSTVLIPLSVGGSAIIGALSFAATRGERHWSDPLIKRLQLVAQMFANALARKRANEELLNVVSEIDLLKSRLEAENVYLREDMKMVHNFDKIVGQSEALLYVLFRMDQVAGTDATVLIQGETGTGKGVVAHAIHGRSPRKDRPLITVNCAALPANLIESELFGREKGAFTGAHARQMGRFEVADRGTIFLDEIGELPLELQAKLLRVIQDGEFERLGSPHTMKVDVRIIVSTSRNLTDEIDKGRFREDLYYRLNVFPITIPPLRQRRDDVPLLVDHFVKKFNRKMGKDIETLPRETMKALQDYSWPGNIRELEHVIERAVITTQGSVLRLAEKVDSSQTRDRKSGHISIADVEREHILRVLEKTEWRIEGNKGAASLLDLNPSTLRSRMQKLEISRPDRKTDL